MATAEQIGEELRKEVFRGRDVVGEDVQRALRKYVTRLGGIVETQEFVPFISDCFAVTTPDAEDDFVVKLSAVASPLADTFTIAHGIGHYFLHCKHGEKGLVLDGRTVDRERQADWFAFGLVTPKQLFQRAQRELHGDTYRIAGRFFVSHRVVEMRIATLGHERV